MEEAWHAKCSSGWPVAPAVPVFPPLAAGSCNQINVNGQQFFHPDVMQAANLGNSQLLQEPLLPCIINKDLRKFGNLEAGNSFLSLLSGRSNYLSGELLPPLNPSSELSKLPISDREAFRQSSTCSFSSNFIPPLSKYHCNDAIFNGVLPSFAASRPLAADLSKDLQPLVPHSDILGSSKAYSRHSSEDITRGIGAYSRGFGSSSPSCSAFLHQNNQASQNLPSDANVHDIISPLLFRDHPRVLCMNTAGELFVDDMGFLGVLCSCHSFPMSVAKFCQHSGLTSTIPCDVIRMENGMTLAQWCKMCFGNLTLGDRRGLDQSKKNSVERGSICSNASGLSSLSKNHGTINSVKAYGELRRSGELKEDTLYAHCPNFMGKISMEKPVINDMDYENEERNSGVNGLLHLTGSTQDAIPSENTNLPFVRATPEFLNTQRLHSTSNRQEPNAASRLFVSNVNFGARSRNTFASHASAGPKKNLIHGKNFSTRGSSSNDTPVIDGNGSDLRLGQPSQDTHSSLNFSPTAINLSLPPVCFSPELQQQNKLSDRIDFARETKRARLNRPSPLPETSTSVRRTPHPENRTTFSLHNSESEDLLTKDSSISLFLSHLTGGTGLSDCSNRTLDVPSIAATSINCDLLSSRENLSWCTGNEIDEIGKASSFNEIHYFNSKGKFPNGVSDSSRNMENIDVHSKQIECRRVNRPSINRQSLHSFPANMGKSSLFSNKPFKNLHMGTDSKNSNKNGKMAILEDGCHLSNIIVRGSEIRATQCAGSPGCIKSDAPITQSSTKSSHISETDSLSCKENVKFQDYLMDGNSRFLASSRLESLMDKHEQVHTFKTNSSHISETYCLSCKENIKLQDHLMDGNSRFLASSRHENDKHEQPSAFKRKSQHGKFCCLSAMESHGNSCTDDLVARRNETYFNIHQSESDLRTGSNCHYNNPSGALHCDPGSGASYSCCNCAASAQKTFPCSTFSSHHICGTKRHLCFRPREISSDTSFDSEYEMCIYKRGGHSVCGNCCCATFSKYLVGCSFNGALNTPDIMNEQNANGMLKHINPTFEKVATFQSGRAIELEQNACFKKTVSAQNNNQTGFWRDASSKIVGSSATISENCAETSDAACKELNGTSLASMPLDAQQIFDPSRSSAPAMTEVSVEVNKRDSQISNVNSGTILHYSLFDEGSGIEKCSSSDERPNTKKCEVVDTSDMSSHSCDNIVAEFKFSGSSKKKGVRNKITAECTEQENSQRHQLTRLCKLRKRKEPSNSDEYNDAVPDSDFLLAHSEPPESINEVMCLLPLSKRVGISMESDNAVEGTCIISSGSSNIKQKRSDFPSSKFVSLKKLGDKILLSNNVHLPEESKNSVPVVEKLDFCIHGKQDPVKRLNHLNDERPRKYMSLSSIVDSRSHESGTSTISKRPVVCGNSGIISSGDLNALQKSPKIVPVDLILKKARRCTINGEVEPKTSLISKMNCTGVKDQNCSKFSSCKSLDGSRSPYFGRSKVGFNTPFISGRKSQLSILDSKKGIKGGWYAEIRSRNISMNHKADTGDRWIMHKKRNSRSEPSSVGVALCCVCESSSKETTNCLVECNRCLISVHQACYGISEVPKDVWYCRPCKRNSRDIESLQSEIDHENIGIYGKCMLHARNDYHTDSPPINAETPSHIINEWSCARTEGFKGRGKGRFPNYQIPFNDGDGCIVSQVQINAWVHINGQKSCIRGGVEPACSDVEHDLRKEYIRYKLSKGWKHLVVYNSSIHDLGLYTSRFITRGAMVVEYVGEVVGLRVADKREIEYQSGRRLQCKSACYFFRIDREQIIDATRKGGIARFVNHSCLPNCVAKVISIKNEKKVVFFAERDINPGEEVTYDYHFNREDEGMKIPCFCNSKNCRRFLN